MGWNEYCLFSESVNYHENSSISGRPGQLLDEIHRDRIQGLLGYRKLLKESIWLMTLRFGTHTSHARLAEVVDEGSESQPCIFAADYQQSCFILTKVSQEYMIMFVLKYSESEISGFGNVDSVIVS